MGEQKKSKSDMAREQLKPLEPGERPRPVTVGAVAAFALAVTITLPYLIGVESFGGTKLTQSLPISILLLVAAIGMWRAKYWAVLGFQAYLVILIIVLSLLLVSASSWLSALLVVLAMAASIVMFWSLVKSMARIQMPR